MVRTPKLWRRDAILTRDAVARIRPMVEQGMRSRDIAEALGVTIGTLRVRCSELKISLRGPSHEAPRPTQVGNSLRVNLSATASERLHDWARARGATDQALATALLETIASDQLCDAVLDDHDDARIVYDADPVMADIKR